MKRFLIAVAMVAAVVLTTDNASAQGPSPYGFLPYGFYQPYGAQYGSSIRTPPYFATNPPVYYGARHSRPYGLSPFAAPPLVVAGDDYRSRLRLQFEHPRVPTPAPLCNPYIVPARHPPSRPSKRPSHNSEPSRETPSSTKPIAWQKSKPPGEKVSRYQHRGMTERMDADPAIS